MMISTIASASHLIQVVPSNSGGLCYRRGPKWWIDKRVFRQYLTERRAIRAYIKGREKVVYLNYYGDHLKHEQFVEELVGLKARIDFLPANSIDLCQPVDSFFTAKLNDIWSRKRTPRNFRWSTKMSGKIRFAVIKTGQESLIIRLGHTFWHWKLRLYRN